MVNVRKVLSRLISLVFWLSTLTVLLTFAYVVFKLFSPAFMSKTLASSNSESVSAEEAVYRLAWEEPFEYEVNVYASTDHGYVRNHTEFFDNAQLLWHIPAQSISNRYPLFRHSAAVEIPEQILNDKNYNTTLYVHAFIQSAGQAAPHPNISDSQLIHFQTELVWWANPRHYREPPSILSKPPQELLSATALPWSIVLEDHRYNKQHLPMHLMYQLFGSYRPLFRRDSTYLPSLFVNQYTCNPIDFMPTVLLTSNDTDKHIKGLTANVDFEIQGIRQIWVAIKDAALALSNPGRDYMYNFLDLADLVVAEGYIDDPNGAGIFSSDGMMSLIGVCGMLFALFNPWSAGRFTEDQANMQTNTLFEDNATPADTYQPLQTNIEDQTYFLTKRARHIIKARKQVDNAALYWLTRLAVPILAAAAIFAGYSSDWKWVELDFVLGFIAALIHLTFWLQWLPQVLVNHQAKDGSLIPVAIQICGLTQYLLGGAFNHLTSTNDIFERVSYAGLVEHVWQAVIIAQWLWFYRKTKQD
ncbi:hypothetical protein LPJ53_001066 [Coemansia erecta]|uniref:Cleft lip and palate transmembrane 1 n=1 Tax=Coemansia erecta TaxID=147472 RepID=A0A9W8CSK0_9FUNG|nr:hypothetical protein LPJ53_001066 [Coemansia erecta]